MNSISFEAFIRDIEDNKWNVHGVEVYKSGKLVNSYGDTTINRYDIYSATKVITSIAVGLALDEGKLNLEEGVLKYIPNKYVSELSNAQRKKYECITLERLLTMSVKGYPFRPEGDSWLRNVLNISINSPEQRIFDYSNVSAYLVGVAVANGVGQDLYDYLNKRLFEPLDIRRPYFERCPDGFFYGASKMKLTVNELSRIGLLLYNKGIFNGQKILSETYVNEATSVKQMCKDGGYGYFIWKYRNGYSINGKWKQKCYILPEDELVITYLCDIKEDSHDLVNSMEKNILGI